jgi:hypothetical protein
VGGINSDSEGCSKEGRKMMMTRVGRMEESSSNDVIAEDFVKPVDRKPSLIPPQIHVSLSLPKIKGNNNRKQK